MLPTVENWFSDEEIDAMLARIMAASSPDPDYACGGVETAEPTIANYMEAMGFTPERRWTAAGGYEDLTTPDLMSAVRDIARGS